jgi:hypothetical protein
VNNLNPNGDPVITVGSEVGATEGARFGIIPAPSGAALDDSSLVFGHDALTSAGSGRRNVAVGSESQKNTTDGRYNISVGNSALENCNSGEGNIAIGDGAMKGAVSPLEGNDQNVAIGFNSLKSIDAYGSLNVAIGSESGGSITAGTFNTLIGALSSTSLTSGSNNSVIGYQAAPATPTATNSITLGNSSISVLRCNVTSLTSLSDKRDKTKIEDSNYGIEFVQKLKPVKFEWDTRDGSKKEIKDLGFIAQDLKEIDDQYLNLVYDENPNKLEASYSRLIPVLVKAIQELSAEVAELKK